MVSMGFHYTFCLISCSSLPPTDPFVRPSRGRGKEWKRKAERREGRYCEEEGHKGRGIEKDGNIINSRGTNTLPLGTPE